MLMLFVFPIAVLGTLAALVAQMFRFGSPLKARAGIWLVLGGLAASYAPAIILLAFNGSSSRIHTSDSWFGAFELAGRLALAIIPAIFGLGSLILYTLRQARSDLPCQSLFC